MTKQLILKGPRGITVVENVEIQSDDSASDFEVEILTVKTVEDYRKDFDGGYYYGNTFTADQMLAIAKRIYQNDNSALQDFAVKLIYNNTNSHWSHEDVRAFLASLEVQNWWGQD